MQGLSIPIIVFLVYTIVSVLKTAIQSAKFHNFLPIISATLGGVFGIVAFYSVPSIVISGNVLQALLIGIISGLTATGSNQVVKQIKEFIDNFNKSINDE